MHIGVTLPNPCKINQQKPVEYNIRTGSLIRNNQPQGKNSIKNIRFCAVVNCSSAYWPCALTGSDRSVRNQKLNRQKPVEFLVGAHGLARSAVPTLRRIR